MFIEFTKNTGEGDRKQRISIQPNDVASVEETNFGTHITTRHSGSHTVNESYGEVIAWLAAGVQQTIESFTIESFTRAMFGVEQTT